MAERLAHVLLRCASPLAGLRRVPVLGDFLSRASRQLVPLDKLIWVQVEAGPAKGLWVRVNPRSGQALLKGTGEPLIQQAIQEYLRSGMTFYDLGANIGFFSLIGARLVGPSGRVISFEADPEIAARLRENLTYNNFGNVLVEEKAVWSECTTVPFVRADRRNSPDRGLGHVAPENPANRATIGVGAVSLDYVVGVHPAPHLIKCDVEGAEVAVFCGADRLLREKRPILLVEMHSEANHAVLTERFTQLGYGCRNLDENHVLALPG